MTSNQWALARALGRFRFPGFPDARMSERGAVLRVLRRGTREGWAQLSKVMPDWLALCWGFPSPFGRGKTIRGGGGKGGGTSVFL